MVLVERAKSRSEQIREQLPFPVIDGDGHVIEPVLQFADFVRDHGRSDLVDAVGVFQMGPSFWQSRRQASKEERRRRRIFPAFWAVPGDTDYFATVTSPRLYYERLGEAGIDFEVLYPTLGLQLLHLAEEDHRVPLCRLYNEFSAERFRPYRDRLTPVALIPMHSPDEAISAMEHARSVDGKVALVASYVRRQLSGIDIPNIEAPHSGAMPYEGSGWIDTFGIDSVYDYDPVWAKALQLGFPLAAHSPGLGLDILASVSSFVFNHMGDFALPGQALAKSLFLGGVTRRFPDLRVALLEGGVVGGVETYGGLVSRWHKRGSKGLSRLNPANIDVERLGALLGETEPALAGYPPQRLVDTWGTPQDGYDEFAASGVQSVEDIRDQFCLSFYWGCEADDPLVGVAFDPRFTPLGAPVPAFLGSDIGHWDVPDFDSPLAEAYELVERGILDQDSFRDFVFTNAVRFYSFLNPNFFVGTAVEQHVHAVSMRSPNIQGGNRWPNS